MELKYISQTTANLIMDALMCAWIELVAEYDEMRIEEGEEWVRETFVKFCKTKNIDSIERGK